MKPLHYWAWRYVVNYFECVGRGYGALEAFGGAWRIVTKARAIIREVAP